MTGSPIIALSWTANVAFFSFGWRAIKYFGRAQLGGFGTMLSEARDKEALTALVEAASSDY